MSDLTYTPRSAGTRRIGLCLALATATLAGPLVGAAQADQDRHWDRHWDRRAWHEGYYRRPDIYYSAPPAVYPPYGYYGQPSATFSFSFPIR